jgi:hypothetical protein
MAISWTVGGELIGGAHGRHRRSAGDREEREKEKEKEIKSLKLFFFF